MYIARGAVFVVPFGEIQFLPRLLREEPKPHPVLVVSTDDVCRSDSWKYVSVVPISTAAKWKTEYCVEAHVPTYKKRHREQRQGAEPSSASLDSWPLTQKSWIRTSHVQPMEKSVLTDERHRGELPPLLIEEVESALYEFLGFPPA